MALSKLSLPYALVVILLIWCSQDSLLSKTTPRYVVVGIISPNIFSPTSFLCWGHLENTTTCDFFALIITCHFLHHDMTLSRAFCAFSLAVSKLRLVLESPTSSAYWLVLVLAWLFKFYSRLYLGFSSFLSLSGLVD